ncbi:MAG: L,D-transpeptidase [Clostridia bacterium]|nr:L,D-transpeptidase [Clostridia bacterium]
MTMLKKKKGSVLRNVIFISSFALIIAGVFVMLCPVLFRSHDATANQENSSSETSDEKKQPEVPSALIPLENIKIDLKFGKKTETIKFDKVKDWVEENPDHSGYKVDEKSIRAYTDMLNDKYSNYKFSVEFMDHSGETLDIENKSTGWIFDPEYAAKKIKGYIENNESVAVDLTDRSKESRKWWMRIASDYDNVLSKDVKTYIEVSIDNQYVWAYKDGEVVLESPIVTGNPNTGHDTPKGFYLLGNKNEHATLYGPGYETEVAYWITIVDDIGFHDATWQYSFGGDVYLYNGSHGCVNLPLDFAEQLYEYAEPDIPVFIY